MSRVVVLLKENHEMKRGEEVDTIYKGVIIMIEHEI